MRAGRQVGTKDHHPDGHRGASQGAPTEQQPVKSPQKMLSSGHLVLEALVLPGWPASPCTCLVRATAGAESAQPVLANSVGWAAPALTPPWISSEARKIAAGLGHTAGTPGPWARFWGSLAGGQRGAG